MYMFYIQTLIDIPILKLSDFKCRSVWKINTNQIKSSATTILALDSVETNPKWSLRKRFTQLNYLIRKSHLQRFFKTTLKLINQFCR